MATAVDEINSAAVDQAIAEPVTPTSVSASPIPIRLWGCPLS
jgi:hypothetical protein